MFAGYAFRPWASRTPLTVGDWRMRARRRVPDMVWAYIENGADDEVTLRANETAFGDWALRQRVLAGVSEVDLRTAVAGTELSMPLALAPTGLAGTAHWHGDLGAARAAETHGTRLVLSSASAYSIEEVAAGTTEQHWFQLYPWRDRELMTWLIRRARNTGYGALFVTVDVPVYGNRLGERRVGMALPPTLTPARLVSAALRPAWCYAFLRHRRTTLKNLIDSHTDSTVESVKIQSANLTADINWDDLAWLREQWRRPLFVKGILDPDDAERAIALGAEGIVVSNHGGRQLDGALPSLAALPAVAGRVGGRAEVLLDGGVRSGRDVAIALALGAKACLIGRPLLYGLAGGGTDGVGSVLEIFRTELERSLTLMGVAKARDLERASVLPARATY
jgi:isopentenyl diphosphate isomerase/L-lactate dehydrogenase-like FMN-dependent dehydrogenase